MTISSHVSRQRNLKKNAHGLRPRAYSARFPPTSVLQLGQRLSRNGSTRNSLLPSVLNCPAAYLNYIMNSKNCLLLSHFLAAGITSMNSHARQCSIICGSKTARNTPFSRHVLRSFSRQDMRLKPRSNSFTR